MAKTYSYQIDIIKRRFHVEKCIRILVFRVNVSKKIQFLQSEFWYL